MTGIYDINKMTWFWAELLRGIFIFVRIDNFLHEAETAVVFLWFADLCDALRSTEAECSAHN